MNNEENKDNEEDIDRNIVQSEQLVTQLQNNNGVTLKTSESTTCENSSERSLQPQLAAKSTTTNTEQKRASKSPANKGKNIIPARRLCLLNHLNGSLIKIVSNKELRTPDNASRKRILKQRYNPHTNTLHNLNDSNPNLKTLKNLNKTYTPYTSKDVEEITQTQHVRNQ